jgi:hypothetical protein
VAEYTWLILFHESPPSPETRPHPLGITTDPWTVNDADLSQAVLISLSAAGKTARTFAWCAQQPRPDNKPLALLQVTRAAADLRPEIVGGPFPVLKIDCSSIFAGKVLEWLRKSMSTRIVICNFGATDDILVAVYSELPKHLTGVHDVMVLVRIESKAEVYKAAERAALVQTFAAINKRLVNTGGLRPAVIALGDAATYCERLDGTRPALLRTQGFGKLAVDRRERVHRHPG